MRKLVRHVQSPLHFIPPAYNPWVMRLVHAMLPLLLRLQLLSWLPAGITRIDAKNIDRLVDLYVAQEAGESRFLMAVRHVEVDDPLVGLYLYSRVVNRAAKARGIRLQQPVHTHFIYERGVTIWAGQGIGWLLSRIGGVPIRRGRRPDRVALKAARKLVTSGNMPLMVAPEGATNRLSERLGPLESGVAQLAFWCAEDLQRTARTETVYILPIGIRYRYDHADFSKLSALLGRLEKDSGYEFKSSDKLPLDRECYLRILRLGVHLLETMEAFYSCHFPQPSAAVGQQSLVQNKETLSACRRTLESAESARIAEYMISTRLPPLLDNALRVAEQFFSLPGEGTLIERCRLIEEAGWKTVYREDLPPVKTLSPLHKGLADWAAQEAGLRELHMRIVESFATVDCTYLREKPSFERCAEMTLLMSDMLARLCGEKQPRKPGLGKRSVTVSVQPSLSVTRRLCDYQVDRCSARAAIAALTEDIRRSLEATIEDDE